MATITEALKAIGNVEPVSTTVGGVALALLPVIYGAQWVTRERIGSVAYLLHMQEELRPSTLSQRILRRSREFIFDVRQV